MNNFGSGMTEIIRLLPDSVVNQIAAGEVIQRPSSVIKELMDNAIDSGATEIKVVVDKGGKELIQVTDNGCGMTPLDARMSFERHATSKIRNSQDLFRIQTLGFRGEALASIAAVAHVEMKTRRKEDETGTLISIRDSKVLQQEACAALPGTQIRVSDLFFSVPARKKFLKSDVVELRHLQEEFVVQALSHPDLKMSFIQDGHELYRCPQEGLRQRIVNVFGKKYNEHLIEINQETDILKISGYLCNDQLIRKSRGEQYLFVNRRPVKNHYLNHAIASTYEEIFARNGYPFYVLFLEIDPEHIDINVHPTKHEIKFDDDRLIYNFLKISVRQTLGKQILAPTLDFDNQSPGIERMFHPKNTSSPINAKADASLPSAGSQAHWRQLAFPDAGRSKIQEREELVFAPPQTSNNELPLHDDDIAFQHPVQLYSSYIMFHSAQGVGFIDQQAAHERILYEQFIRTGRDSAAASRQLLFPITLHLSKTDAHILLKITDILRQNGVEIEAFGADSFIIHAIPAALDEKIVEKDMISSMIEQYKMNLEFDFSPAENVARSLAATQAVRRGTRLSTQEMNTIIENLFLCQNPNTTPGGKKCIHLIKLDEFFKLFGN
ncbi:MAG TPA: DNA mismatch repair endonuclease MutL [Saprospiraceae bacterium]|nr:DNA mismatch repair endonuclease MutL [Saprospiraceae bacterium]HNA65610.1 DNA mismatch repair endonuclease MutL [Saprospiraceae bacterium]HNM54053.1 DNA mismatch repair endonuclease MutL [Saprospiraceae bacterium]